MEGGDVSEWGRKKVPHFYNSRDDASDYTLSSGLSPRDGDDRDRKPFDLDQAKSVSGGLA